ncbi:low molecular weight protein-tyrosine-phosphatase [Amorphus sp. MBR-141]
MTTPEVRSILFVCLGNICRSPMAAGIVRSLVVPRQPPLAIESAGVGPWHVGKPPDGRAVAAAQRSGIDLSEDRARMLTEDDFHTFDLILAMDSLVLADICQRAPAGAPARIALFRAFAEGVERDVPDPYYGGDDGFDEVFVEIEAAARALLARL